MSGYHHIIIHIGIIIVNIILFVHHTRHAFPEGSVFIEGVSFFIFFFFLKTLHPQSFIGPRVMYEEEDDKMMGRMRSSKL